MCGIAGIRKFGDDPITGEEIITLLCSIEHRGKHATGLALATPEGIRVLKAPLPAWKFTLSQEFKDFLEENLTPQTTIAILHTRWATIGNPEINANNHPMFDGETAIVHNGGISNHFTLFTNGKYTRSCETDSDIVRAIVSEHGFNSKGLRELNKMNGSAAIACISEKEPGKLLLARSGSPIIYGFTPEGSKLYWASEAHAIIKATRPWKCIRGTWVQEIKSNVSIGTMPDNTGWIFNDTTMELHGEFSVCMNYRKPDYSRGRETYHLKTKGWKRELKYQKMAEEAKKKVETKPDRGVPLYSPLYGVVIKCPGCGVGNRNETGADWSKLACAECGSILGS